MKISSTHNLFCQKLGASVGKLQRAYAAGTMLQS